MSEKKKIFDGLYRYELGNGNVDFRTLLSSLATVCLAKSALDADTFADANLTKYWNWLLREFDAQKSRGLLPYYETVGSNTRVLTCACSRLCSAIDAADRRAGELGLARPHLLRQIDQLTDRQYEALACVTCDALGTARHHLTPPGNEGGIDFVASMRVSNRSHLFSAPSKEIRLIGQCKKYTTPVAVDRLDQFIETMHNVRYRSERVRPHLPAWFESGRGPIVGWIISHSGYQSGAVDEAQKHGIILSDSLDIAEVIAQSEMFHPNASPSARADALITSCQALLLAGEE